MLRHIPSRGPLDTRLLLMCHAELGAVLLACVRPRLHFEEDENPISRIPREEIDLIVTDADIAPKDTIVKGPDVLRRTIFAGLPGLEVPRQRAG